MKLIPFAVDVGNSSIKYSSSPSDANLVPSFLLTLEDYQEAEPSAQTKIAHYIEGDNKNLIGKRWTIGSLARDLGGTPFFSLPKHEVAAEAVLPLIDGAGLQNVKIEKLVYSLPEDRKEDQRKRVKDSLIGAHRVIVNGIERNIIIEDVKIVFEGLGAYNQAVSLGLIGDENETTNVVLLDVGTRTTIITPFTSRITSGIPMRNKRKIAQGLYYLASLIREGSNLKNADIGTIKESSILAAIEDKSFTYETTGVSFKEDFIRFHNTWYSTIYNETKEVNIQASNVGRLIVVGGGASLMEEICNKAPEMIKICPNARFANVMGMLRL